MQWRSSRRLPHRLAPNRGRMWKGKRPMAAGASRWSDQGRVVAGLGPRLHLGLERVLGLVVLGLVLLSSAERLSAQGLRLELIEAGADRPLNGVFVTLENEAGERLAAGLTDASGRATLSPMPDGAVVLRAELLGYATGEWTVSGMVPGPDPYRLALLPSAIPLEGLVAEAASRCEVRPADRGLTALVWEEARKALDLARWVQEQEVYDYQVTRYTRRYGREGRQIVEETPERSRGFSSAPFESRSPELLAREGYLVESGEGIVAVAPDANALLSDAFLRTHCLQAWVENEEIGLDFEPVEEGEIADLKGTILLDPETAALRSVRFWYVGDRAEELAPSGQGEVEFERLSSGAWIVRRWWVRTPIREVQTALGRPRSDTRIVTTGYFEFGGEVVTVRGGPGGGR